MALVSTRRSPRSSDHHRLFDTRSMAIEQGRADDMTQAEAGDGATYERLYAPLGTIAGGADFHPRDWRPHEAERTAHPDDPCRQPPPPPGSPRPARWSGSG